MEFVERLLRHHFSSGHGKAVESRSACRHRVFWLHAIHIPGHELYFSLIEGRAALVVHRHPADDVQDVALLGGDEVVASLPRETTAQIGYLGVNLTRRTGV